MRRHEQQRENNATCEIPQCFVCDKDGVHGFTDIRIPGECICVKKMFKANHSGI